MIEKEATIHASSSMRVKLLGMHMWVRHPNTTTSHPKPYSKRKVHGHRNNSSSIGTEKPLARLRNPQGIQAFVLILINHNSQFDGKPPLENPNRDKMRGGKDQKIGTSSSVPVIVHFTYGRKTFGENSVKGTRGTECLLSRHRL